MLQSAKQEPQQDKPRGNPRWVKGVSQNPRGRESKAARLARREATIARWAEPFGGVATLKPAEVDLLHQAAELSLIRPRTVEDAVRVANTISKILAQVGFADRRKREPAGPTATDLRTYLAGLKTEATPATASPAVATPPERDSKAAEPVGTTDERFDDVRQPDDDDE
jgi:hypothetical protein